MDRLMKTLALAVTALGLLFTTAASAEVVLADVVELVDSGPSCRPKPKCELPDQPRPKKPPPPIR
jgi:hypothetical protein